MKRYPKRSSLWRFLSLALVVGVLVRRTSGSTSRERERAPGAGVSTFRDVELESELKSERESAVVIEMESEMEKDDASESIKDAPVFVAFADHVSDGVCASVETAALAGVDLHVVGLDQTEFDFSHVSHAKSKKIHGYLKLLTNAELRQKYGITRDEAIVVLSDSSDVIYTQNASQRVAAAYDSLRQQIAPSGKALVLFSAEGNCWPHMADSQELIPGGREYCAKFHERANGSSNKFLNSGGVIGPAFALVQLYREIESRMQTVNDEDQMMTALVYGNQIDEERAGTHSKNYVIALDHQARVFQTGWHTHLEVEGKYAERQEKGAYFNPSEGVFVNTEHDTTPIMVHFNGGKTNFYPSRATSRAAAPAPPPTRTPRPNVASTDATRRSRQTARRSWKRRRNPVAR